MRRFSVFRALLFLGLQMAFPVVAQDEVTPQDASFALSSEEDGFLSEEVLDELVAPVALYPDALLTQILVASTYPIDVMKADRFVGENEGLEQSELADLAAEQDWDESVRVLASGFPSVVQNMAAEVDWTEGLGEAMLAQTDDLLDAVQRQRARADAVGNLESNEAQVVEVVDDNISISPADQDVVYVPTYDPQTTYTQPATVAPVTTDTGLSTGNILTTGAIAFGSALLIDEIFDDDDDYYDDYWRGPRIDWDDAELYPGREINVDGDVNVDLDGDRVNVGNRRPKIGDKDLDLDRKDGAWKPDQKRKNDAKEKIADRNKKNNGGKTDAARKKLKAGSSSNDASGARAKLDKATSERKPKAGSKNTKKDNALKHKSNSSTKTKKASQRGKASLNKSSRDSKPKAKPKVQKPKISKPSSAKKPTRKAAPKQTAMKKRSGGGRAKASKSRGKKSHGKRKRR